MTQIVMDLDNTICISNGDYAKARPKVDVIKKLRDYKKQGFHITIHTARNMNSFKKNVGLINVHTLPIILKWLDENDVPYDEVIIGKPWCGVNGFYVDDRAIRPDEFVGLDFEGIQALLSRNELK